jgi:PAS domain S-box-containing protein
VSIRAQLAALALLVALPLVALVAYRIYAEFRADAVRAADTVQRVARAAASDTRRALDETERVLKRLAQRPAVRAMSAQQCDPAIEDFRAAVAGYANIITIDRGANLVCSAVQVKAARTTLGDVDWVQQALKAGGLYVSRPTVSIVTGAPVVYVTFPVDGGLIAAALDLSGFEPVSEASGLLEDTMISIVDADGFMVARSSDARAWVGKNVRGQGVIDVVLARKSGTVIAPGLRGVERVFGFVEVPGVPWVVYAGVRSDAVFAQARADALRTAAVAGLIILATGALVLLLAGRISRPMGAIGRAVHAVGEGRLEVRAPVTGAREIAQLAAEFNRMLEQRVEHERLLNRVTDSAPAIIHVKDAEGRHRLVNREFERVTGLSREQVIGKRDAELFEPELVAMVTKHDREALLGSGVLVVEETVTRSGATRHYVAGKASLRDAQGRPYLLCTAAIDITEQKKLEERQRQLSRRVFEVSEEERQRLSRDLHDRIGQPLAALRINLDVLRKELPPHCKAGLDKQAALIEELIRLVRQLTGELRPAELDGIGLAAALRNYAELASERYGFAVDVLGPEFSPRLPRATERALFRVAQEALANAAKHAGAETVTIELDDEGGEARLSVSDDGRGIAADKQGRGFGLHTMRERIEEVGGRLEIESAQGLGTRVIAAVGRNR